MTQYKHTVGASPQSVIGNLTWNQNGTLRQLAVTDPFNAQNQQTCNYGYDDLTRISSANCGSIWSQTFGFDVWGNLTKDGSARFQVTCDPSSNNRIGPGQGFSYDANGNTTQYNTHSYTWDGYGHLLTLDALGLTYDALDRMVEQQNGSTYTQILYGPTGGKLALMNGQAVSKAFIPLPAGATAVYTAGPTLSYFRHPDWLGSSRFASTPSRTMYSDLAYAPFGETYAEAGTPDRSFTGQNQDTVPDYTAGLYDFLFREYAQYGRWISPDPAGLAAVDIANPQSWNRYAYVLNNPLSLTDPLGLRACLDLDGNVLDPCPETNPHHGDDGPPDPVEGAGPSFREDFITLGPGVRIPIRLPWGWLPSVHRLWEAANWSKTFFTSFIELSGGPGNVPTCADQALNHIAEQFLPISPSVASGVQTAAPAAQAAAINGGIAQTQAGIDAYIATKGLTVPLRSSVVRTMAAQGAESAVAAGLRANVAVQTAAVDYATVQSTITTSREALNGECAAAFPVVSWPF